MVSAPLVRRTGRATTTTTTTSASTVSPSSINESQQVSVRGRPIQTNNRLMKQWRPALRRRIPKIFGCRFGLFSILIGVAILLFATPLRLLFYSNDSLRVDEQTNKGTMSPFPRWRRIRPSWKTPTSPSLYSSILNLAQKTLEDPPDSTMSTVANIQDKPAVQRVYLVHQVVVDDDSTDTTFLQRRRRRQKSQKQNQHKDLQLSVAQRPHPFATRSTITETFWIHSLQYLQQLPDASSHYPRLVQALWPSGHDDVSTAPSFVFLMNYGDSTFCCHDDTVTKNHPSVIPIFTLSAPTQCNDTWPVPTYETIRQSTPSSSFLFPGGQWRWWWFRLRYRPWNQKPMAIWRGSPTGSGLLSFDTTSASTNPRIRLCQMALQYPHLLDAKLTSPPPLPNKHNKDDSTTRRNKLDNPNATMWYKELMGDRIRMYDFQKYRAIVDVDGNSWSMRFGLLLCFSSVVIKVQPQHVDYFYPELVPWVHFIPVQADLSDLIRQVEYAVSDEHQESVQQIIRNANAWCRRKHRLETLYDDMLSIWNEYLIMLDHVDPGWQMHWSKSDKEEWLAKYPFKTATAS